MEFRDRVVENYRKTHKPSFNAQRWARKEKSTSQHASELNHYCFECRNDYANRNNFFFKLSKFNQFKIVIVKSHIELD